MEKPEQYQRCLVFAGGGFRFAYYLGVHAAAQECQRRPDLLLASCGGAIAAAVIVGCPDRQARLDWMLSPHMYRFLRGIRATPRATPVRTLGAALLRWRARTPAHRIPDVFEDYLFELPDEFPLPAQVQPDAPAVAIIGSRLLFRPEEAGQVRGARCLFEEVVFCPARGARLLAGSDAPASDARWSSGAVCPSLGVDASMPIPDAVRISIADMFYFRSHAHAGQHYMGGVIDLCPIEVAQRMAREVIMERKAPFNPSFALPALRAALGIDGAARLRHVHAQDADAWVDTSDMSQALHAHGIGKRILWRQNRIGLEVPDTLHDYAAQIRVQWDYGYRKGMTAFQGAPA
jgi:hypothetical protein